MRERCVSTSARGGADNASVRRDDAHGRMLTSRRERPTTKGAEEASGRGRGGNDAGSCAEAGRGCCAAANLSFSSSSRTSPLLIIMQSYPNLVQSLRVASSRVPHLSRTRWRRLRRLPSSVCTSDTHTLEVERSRSVMDGREGVFVHRRSAYRHPGKRIRNAWVRSRSREEESILRLRRSNMTRGWYGLMAGTRGSRTTETVRRSDEGQVARIANAELKKAKSK
jgi:hypothetical protein